MEDVVTFLVAVGFVAVVAYVVKLQNAAANDGIEEVVCPHCHERGHVTAKVVTRGKGVSGGKATAGLLTGGLSLPFAGLSKNQEVKRLTCGNCHMSWDVE